MSEQRTDIIARAICKSGKFETGQGTCALLCMDHLGNARRDCSHATQVHADLARQIDDSLMHEVIERLTWLSRRHGIPSPELAELAVSALRDITVERDILKGDFTELKRHAMEEGCSFSRDEFGAPYVINRRAESLEQKLAEALKIIKPFASVPYAGGNAFNRAGLSDDNFRAARHFIETQTGGGE